jgi:hypothetical protein
MELSRPLNIVVEANVSERKPHRSVVEIPFTCLFRDEIVQGKIKGYDVHEMPGTKIGQCFIGDGAGISSI